MLKKTLYFIFTFIFFILFKTTNISAKEVCHIFVNNEYKETMEMPFYYYIDRLKLISNNTFPILDIETTDITIDSITKCESIDTATHYDDPINGKTLINFDYSKEYLYFEERGDIGDFDKIKIIKGRGELLDKEPPVFEGYKTSYITNFDNPISTNAILKNISVYDKVDGNITDKMVIELNEYEKNSNRLGTHLIILSAIDNANNKASITISVEIIDTTPPIINGTDYFTSPLSNPLNTEKIRSEVSASDNVNGDVTSQIYICDDTYSANKNELGTYNVFFCVYDSSGNYATPFKTTIEVIDDIIPIIEGLDYFNSYLSSPLSVNEILYSLAAIDNGKDISDNIFILNDYYTNYKNTLGEKHIYFQVMDAANNISVPFKVTVNLIDDISPQIFGLNIFNSYMSNPLTLTYLKQQLSVLDNFDGSISHRLEILDDSYTNNINKKGTYTITFQAKDYSNNISESFTININNIDDIPPTIIGPSSLSFSLKNKPSLEDLLSEYNAIDNVDEKVNLEVISNTYSEALIEGTYYIKLICRDLNENESIPFSIKIELTEILLKLNEISISLPTSKLHSIEEINTIINLENSYKILENSYTPNYNIVGTYKIEYELEDYTKIILTINTYDVQQNEESITKEELKPQEDSIKINTETKKETFFTKLKRFFQELINKIIDFIKSLKLLYIYLNS